MKFLLNLSEQVSWMLNQDVDIFMFYSSIKQNTPNLHVGGEVIGTHPRHSLDCSLFRYFILRYKTLHQSHAYCLRYNMRYH